ncbi:MAG: endonuclease [Chromatiaceae bacterium]|nr:endonuclease [Chromatiaceae bacterium]
MTRRTIPWHRLLPRHQRLLVWWILAGAGIALPWLLDGSDRGQTGGIGQLIARGDLPRVAESFSEAKQLLYTRVQHGQSVTAYCGCTYNGRRQVDLRSCGLERYAGNARARRVEAEHVFPAAQFGNFRRCWREPEAYRACRQKDGDLVSGRECCLRVDETFVAAHNDLQNLIPAVGMINGDRRDYRWGMATNGDRYGACDIRIDASNRRVQPPDALKGDIARIMLYMRDTYGFRLSRQDERLFSAWNNLDPVYAWERTRQARIARLQRRANPYVEDYRPL